MTGKNLGVDVGTSGGDWLFRQEGLVLGPVPAKKLVEMLYAGEIDGKTEIARMGSSSFKHLAHEEFFKVHFAKAEAKRRVDHAAAQDRAQAHRRRNVKIAVIGAIALTLAVGAAAGAQYLAIHNPFSNADELAFSDITVEPPTITVAKAHVGDEELVDYPGAPRTSPQKASGTTPTTAAAANPGNTSSRTQDKRPGADAKKPIASASASKPSKMNDPGLEPDGLQMAQFDQSAINAVVASKQKTLYPCFVEEAKRTPGLSAKIPVEFVIGNDGRVAKLWVDHPQYKSGALYDCLLSQLQKWPFKPYEGERATVGLSFNIGKKH